MPNWLQFLEITYKEGEFSFKLGPVFTILFLLALGLYIWRLFRSGGILVAKKVAIKTPIGDIEVDVDRSEQIIAWKLYVELVTRGATQPLALGQGDLCASVESVYKLFTRTRELLQDATIPPRRSDIYSVGLIGAQMLNEEMRPFLTEWHPRSLEWEKEGSGVSELASDDAHYREALAKIQSSLRIYAKAFAKIANINEEVHNEMLPSLTIKSHTT
jgi:hypothetical protein